MNIEKYAQTNNYSNNSIRVHNSNNNLINDYLKNITHDYYIAGAQYKCTNYIHQRDILNTNTQYWYNYR